MEGLLQFFYCQLILAKRMVCEAQVDPSLDEIGIESENVLVFFGCLFELAACCILLSCMEKSGNRGIRGPFWQKARPPISQVTAISAPNRHEQGLFI